MEILYAMQVAMFVPVVIFIGVAAFAIAEHLHKMRRDHV